MASLHSNLAYDFSAYQQAPEQPQKPQLRVVEKKQNAKRAMSAAFTPASLGAFAIVVTMVCLIIYNQVCMTEITGEINNITRDLKILDSEYVRMTSEVETAVSLRSVADQAKEQLGMQRIDKYQTEYVNLFHSDQIILSQEPKSDGLLGIKLAMSGVAERIQEYLSQQ